MATLPSLIEMLEAGVHFGHQENRWHPKFAPYIFGVRNGVHIINLKLTAEKLTEALDYVRRLSAEGKKILFLATKRQAQDIVKKYAELCGAPYLVERWPGGMLTNFSEIKRLIQKYLQLQEQKERGELAKFTKKEQLEIDRTIEKLSHLIEGIKGLTALPDAMFMIDIRHEKTAVAEANRMQVPIVALSDSNTNPEKTQYPIPGNDDAIRSIEMVTRLVAEAVKDGKEEYAKQMDVRAAAVAAAKQEERKKNTTPVVIAGQ